MLLPFRRHANRTWCSALSTSTDAMPMATNPTRNFGTDAPCRDITAPSGRRGKRRRGRANFGDRGALRLRFFIRDRSHCMVIFAKESPDIETLEPSSKTSPASSRVTAGFRIFAAMATQANRRGGEQHINYSGRVLAQDQVEVMHSFGFDRPSASP
jgi:hypothetical protein